MDDCIFCKIIKGDLPCTKVYEDENVFAFLSIEPNNQGHTLVLPKNHSRNILDVTERDIETLFLGVQKISKAIISGLSVSGVNVIMNNEPEAGQAVFHSHVHIIPRIKDDGLHGWERRTPYQNGEEIMIADKIFREIH